ncbi:MAG: hypothetical protein H0W06_00440 [Chloroflexia bacterium]|nr:hypothetical protein [Chloroflexia bacterium]
MNLLETVRSAYAAGVELWLDDGRLRYRSPGPLSADLRAQLAAYKAEITTLFTVYGVGETDDYPSALPKRYPAPPGCVGGGVCPRLGWCERALTGLSCDRTKEPASNESALDGKEAA